MPAVSLTDLQQQIAARERELQTLRQQLESRQGHLTELTRRKEELQRQLRKVEEEITALAPVMPTKTERRRSVAPTTPPTPEPAASVKGQPRLGELILTLLREAEGPRTARQLREEARQRGYQSQSRDPVNSVENRLQDLKNKGIVRRASGQPGYILTPAADGTSKEKSKARQPAATNSSKAAHKPIKPASAAKKESGKGSASSGSAQKIHTGHREEQPPLRELLTGILQNNRKPRSVAALAVQILSSGYRTDSKRFVEVVRLRLRNMANVEHVPDKGYQLKKKT